MKVLCSVMMVVGVMVLLLISGCGECGAGCSDSTEVSGVSEPLLLAKPKADSLRVKITRPYIDPGLVACDGQEGLWKIIYYAKRQSTWAFRECAECDDLCISDHGLTSLECTVKLPWHREWFQIMDIGNVGQPAMCGCEDPPPGYGDGPTPCLTRDDDFDAFHCVSGFWRPAHVADTKHYGCVAYEGEKTG